LRVKANAEGTKEVARKIDVDLMIIIIYFVVERYLLKCLLIEAFEAVEI
jgi:hypothetical protein